MAYSSGWKTTVDVFAVVGSIFTVIGTVVAIIAGLPDNWVKNSFIERSQVRIANAIVPPGYIVTGNSVTLVRKNSTFSLQDPEGILLARSNGSDSLGVSRSGGGTQTIMTVNNKPHIVKPGDIVDTTDQGCGVFFASLKDEAPYKYNLVYKCN